MSRFDVAILGGGFAGSILARCLAAEGARLLLLEKAVHPRFALGESTTPLANFALERLATRYGFADLHSLAAWGRWTRDLPHLRRGLKRGFTFYRHSRDEAFRSGPRNEARAFFAASPDESIADTHWLRADVDHHLLSAAREVGVEGHEGAEVVDLDFGRGVDVTWVEKGVRHRTSADRVVDASGGAGLVSRRLGLDGPDPLPFRTRLLATHVEGLPSFLTEPHPTVSSAPYPEERAAVHHLLEDAWLYVLPFDGPSPEQSVVSVGVVQRLDRAAAMPGGDGSDVEAAFRKALSRFPSLARQFQEARAVTPWMARHGIAFRRTQAASDRWLLLPGAYAFFDPLFSTGIAWSLLGVERARDVVCGAESPARYGRQLAREADQMARLVESAWLALGSPGDLAFDDFVAVALCYFGAVSWAESLGRLVDPGDAVSHDPTWHGFLGAADEVLERVFTDVLHHLRADAPRVPGALRTAVVEQLRERDVAGLDQPPKSNVFPLDLELLVRRAERLGLDRETVRARLDRLRGQSASQSETQSEPPWDSSSTS